MATVNQPTSAPTRKVSAAGIGGAASIVLVFIINLLFGMHLPEGQLPAEVASAITALVSFFAGYIVKEEA